MTAMIACASLWLDPASAGVKMSEAEYALLPEYCRAQGNVEPPFYGKYGSDELERKWRLALQGNYAHYHHYCWSIVLVARAYRGASAANIKTSLASNAIDAISYVLERSTPDFILLPDIYTKLGEAYLLLNDDRNAEAAFRKAWEIKPAYWRAYVWWAQRLMQLGRTREALAIAEEGQRNAPGAAALDDLVGELRGSKGARKK